MDLLCALYLNQPCYYGLLVTIVKNKRILQVPPTTTTYTHMPNCETGITNNPLTKTKPPKDLLQV